MKDYISLLFTDFLVFLLKQIFKNIFYSLIVALLVLFFGRVLFQDQSPFLIYWKWCYISLLGFDIISFVYKSVTTWPLIKGLATGWSTSIKEVYVALIRNGLGKKWKTEQILEWSVDEFRMRRNINMIVSKLFD